MSKKKNTTPSAKPKARLTLGFVIVWGIDNDYSNPVWSGMMEAAREFDFNLLAFSGRKMTDLHFESFNPAVWEQINAANLDGLVVVLTELKALRQLKDYGTYPIITIGIPNDELPGLIADNYDSMKAEINHLIEQHNRTKIAFFRGWEGHPDADARFQAYQDALAEHGLPHDPRMVLAYNFLEMDAAEQVMHDFIEKQIPFDAIASSSDKMAIGAMRALEKHNLRVPYDVSIVSFDDIPEASFTTSPLTTVRQPLQDMGRRAAELLLAHIRGDEIAAREVLPSIPVRRQSCGCFSDDVLQGNPSPDSESIISRAKTVDEMAQFPDALDVDGAGRLFDALVASVKDKTSDTFLTMVDETSRQFISQAMSVAGLNIPLSILRRQACLMWADQPADLGQAEDLLQQARTFVGEAMLRQQSQHQAEVETQTTILREFGEVLITTFDIKELMGLVSRDLPKFGINSCYLALYTQPGRMSEKAKLILAQKEGQLIALDEASQAIFTHELVPSKLLPDQRFNLLSMPLYFRDDWLGYVVLEVNSREGIIYDTLRGQLSSALQGALLVQSVEEHVAELTRQQYILDTFMESLPDRIYFKDTQSRITRANKALATKTGANDPKELIGKSDFDFFPAEQAQIKYQQEQELMKTGQPILGLEEPDGVGLWALTTKMPLRDEKGVVIGTFGISSDITEWVKARQKAEAALAEADKARKVAEEEKEKAEAAKNDAQKAHREAEIANQTLAAQMWQTSGQALLNERMRGEQDIPTLANNVIQQLCKYMETYNGAIYILEDKILQLAGTYAYRQESLARQYQLGEDLVGQAAVEKEIIFKEIPDDYIALISQRQGKLLPKYNLVAPVAYNQQVSGVITMESMTQFTPAQRSFLEMAMESVAIAFMTAQARTRVNQLFAQTRQQAEELQAQEEELRATNEELEAQTESLRASEERLKANQAALEAANADLEEKTHILQEQQNALDRQNQVLRDAQQELERKAEELTITNKYKSEFLANMSHELRTPLNSLLILSRMLAKNEGGNLTESQTESAQIIYNSGADLLELINDILDLSKVEAGHMTFNFAPMPLENLTQSMRSQFEHIAAQKDLEFETSLASGLPESITTDQQRVEQIVKNLLSNAFKFTEQGAVRLSLEPDGEMVAIHVRDSGIGMTPEQQRRVFEAFQQADGSTSRKYGGTGLGLTISRELSAKLGGKIGIESEPGKGSVFTLYLPLHHAEGEIHATLKPAPVSETAKQAEQPPAPPPQVSTAPAAASKPRSAPFVGDDHDKIQEGDKILLVIEDDPKFAEVLFKYAHKKEFKCLVAGDGESGLKLASEHQPDAILLDLKLPGMSGWDVLDTLKDDGSLRHIPVHILSAVDETMDAYKRGALGFLSKPISQDQLDNVFSTLEEFLSRDIKSLLVVEDDSGLRHSVSQLLGGSDVQISEAASGAAALDLLRQERFDCMILDLSLPDMTGFELLGKISQDSNVSKCPVVVYTGQTLTEEENTELLKYASSVIIKGVKSPERLLDETALFLHRVVADMSAEKQRAIHLLHDRDAVFSGKHVLVVDDNARNAFALSRLLSDRKLRVTIARSGQKALEMLDTIPDIDLVLMDIMMPEMDGYETMRKVRAQPKFKSLPILALTAKAMKGDMEKCMAAGANDYLSKPIDADRLFSMLRVWLYR